MCTLRSYGKKEREELTLEKFLLDEEKKLIEEEKNRFQFRVNKKMKLFKYESDNGKTKLTVQYDPKSADMVHEINKFIDGVMILDDK